MGGPGWPPVRREHVDGHRAFPRDGPGVVGAVLPKDLPTFVDDPRGEDPLLVSPRSGPFSRQDVPRHEFEEIDRSARRRRADVAAEDHGSDGRGCGDGAWEASESGLPSVWRSQRGASVVPITRTPRPFHPPHQGRPSPFRRRGPRKRRARVRGRRAGSKRERPPLSLALSARRRRRSYHPHSPSFFAPLIKGGGLGAGSAEDCVATEGC